MEEIITRLLDRIFGNFHSFYPLIDSIFNSYLTFLILSVVLIIVLKIFADETANKINEIHKNTLSTSLINLYIFTFIVKGQIYSIVFSLTIWLFLTFTLKHIVFMMVIFFVYDIYFFLKKDISFENYDKINEIDKSLKEK